MKEFEKLLPFWKYLAEWKLKNFQPYELLIHVNRKNNRLPPKRIWDNIIPTILVLDELRDHLDSPITISSCYRREAYNKGIPGSSSKSQHQAFTAIDFHVRDYSPDEVGEVLKKWKDEDKRFLLRRPLKQKQVKVAAGDIPFKPLVIYEEDGKKYFEMVGGLSVYNNFVHIDSRGMNRTWKSKKKKKKGGE